MLYDFVSCLLILEVLFCPSALCFSCYKRNHAAPLKLCLRVALPFDPKYTSRILCGGRQSRWDDPQVRAVTWDTERGCLKTPGK